MIKYKILLLMCIYVPTATMDLTNTPIDPNTYITLITGDNINSRTTFIRKKYLEESEFFNNFLEDFDNKSINLINTIPYSINHKLLTRLLEPCLRYLYVINNTKASDILKKSTHKVLNNFLKKLNNHDLHRLINYANYFIIPCLFDCALKVWTERARSNKEMRLFYSKPNVTLCDRYPFNADVKKEMTNLLMKPIIVYLIHNHIKNSHIHHTKLLNRKHTHAFKAAKFNSNDTRIAAGSSNNTIYIGHPKTGEILFTLNTQNPVTALEFAKTNANILISGSANGTINIWDINKKETIQRYIGHSKEIKDICFSPDEKLFASSSNDKTIRVWNIENGTCEHILTGHTGCVWKLYFENDTTLYSASTDNSIRIWDLKTNKEVTQFNPSFGELSINKNYIATDTDENTIILRKKNSGDIIASLSGHKAFIFGIAFSPDGSLLASASRDKTIRIWDTKAHKCLRVIRHNNSINSITFSPTGQFLLSTSNDRTTRIWNIFPQKIQNVLSYLRNQTTQDQALFLTLAYKMHLAQKMFIIDQLHLINIYEELPIHVKTLMPFAVSIKKQKPKRKRGVYTHSESSQAKRRKKLD